ncbi:MAG TPA: phosphate acyltransferase PlsX [Alphaproteobacteria bacterium]|nr:phosphate acyltransferase PlsX [Alphaproteobacteria bacterium]
MTGHLTIALDAMGGDNAPQSVLNGANLARKRFPQVRFLMYGDEARLAPMLDRLPRLKKVTHLKHTDQVVTDDAKPSVALRSGRGSSMRLAIDAVQEGHAAGIVSAGNTGALMAMSKFVLKTLAGIDRPAMASFFPTLRGESVMLDLGANVECTADNLVQFAVLGEVFARTVLGLMRPTVGLLNVGSEELKGNDAVRAAAARLKEMSLPIDFHGFIEGNDIAAGTVDVIVADGFTGNIALKTAEGTARLYSEFLRQAFRSSTVSKLGYLLARPALRKLRKRVDPRRYNGAVFLGLNGIVVKSHGGSDSLSFATAIGVAVDMAVNGFLDTIRGELERLQSAGSMDQPAAAVKA